MVTVKVFFSRLSTYISIFVLLLTLSNNAFIIYGQQRDYNVFKKVILSKEGKIDLHAPQTEFTQAVKELEASFSTEISPLDQFKLLSLAIAKIQCGHTQVHANKDVLKEWLTERNSLPIDYYLVGKRLVVNRLLPADKAFIDDGKSRYKQAQLVPAGAEIISIDGKSVQEIMQRIDPYLSSDENSIEFKYYQASQLFDFFRHISIPFNKDNIALQYAISGDTNEVILTTGTAPVHTMNARLQKSEENFKLNELDFGQFKIKNRTAYFRFKSFKSSYGKRYDTFLEKSFKKIKDQRIDQLVIDLRGNTGGAMQYSFMRYLVGEGIELGRYVVEKPKKGIESFHIKQFSADYLKHMHASRLQKRLIRKNLFNNGTILTEKVDNDLIYNGDIVVITDEGTFSSAAILACHLKTMSNAKIVGRTAGGSFYSGNAGTLILQLPQSKIKLYVNPNTFYSHLTPVKNPIAIKTPDIELNPIILNEKLADQYYFKAARKAFDLSSTKN